VPRRAAVGLALFALLPLGGCGTGGLAEGASTGNGQQLFREKCASCHTLADAGARGVIGPNLDHAFAVPIEEGFDESSIREVVLGQMRYPVAPMPPPEELFPPGEYTEEEREEAMNSIAAYVASVAGREPTSAAGGGAAGGGAAGASDPKALFNANCASCHTLAAAGSSGTIGPSLDESTLAEKAIAQQILKGGGGMPAFEGTLSNAQIQALAKYVAENRAR
jgi:cbb3-type cytochrome c oxidase subunit III